MRWFDCVSRDWDTQRRRFHDDDVTHKICQLLQDPTFGGLAAQLLRLMPETPSDVSASKVKKRLMELASGSESLDPAVAADVVEVIVKRYGEDSRTVKSLLSTYLDVLKDPHEQFESGEGKMVCAALGGLKSLYQHAISVRHHMHPVLSVDWFYRGLLGVVGKGVCAVLCESVSYRCRQRVPPSSCTRVNVALIVVCWPVPCAVYRSLKRKHQMLSRTL